MVINLEEAVDSDIVSENIGWGFPLILSIPLGIHNRNRFIWGAVYQDLGGVNLKINP